MTDIKVTDRRGAIAGGPRHPVRKRQYVSDIEQMVKQRDSLKSVVSSMNPVVRSRLGSGSTSDEDSMRRSRQGSVELALPKNREPMGTWKSKGIPYERDSFEDREKIRSWARTFYTTHNLQSLCIDVYTRFPIQGMELTCKDKELTKFYEQLFFDEMDYENFMIDFGREFWISGEVTTLANFNETLGVWSDEEILNPDDVQVQLDPFNSENRYKLRVPEYLKEIIKTRKPKWEYELLNEIYPEIVEAAKDEENTREEDGELPGLEVSPVLLSRTLNKVSPWDLYGTPHMLRCFSQLMMEESLNAAQDAVADRLYAPFIQAKLGMSSQDLGDSGPAWIPDPGELDDVTQLIQTALAADFRLLVHHFGLDIKSVFGRESMPRLDNDYDRLERKQLQVWGIGESMVSGSSGGPYASSALNREFVTQLMSTYQKQIRKHFKKRAEVVAEAQEHFDYRLSGTKRVPIMEEVVKYDPESGKEFIVKRPKLLIPEINFATINLRDETTERSFVQTLKSLGVPISDNSLMVNIPIEFEEELEKAQEEKVQKVVAEQEFKKKARETLMAKGLPVPAELKEETEAPVHTSPEGEPSEPGESQEQSEPVGDITEPPDTPNLTPVDETPGGGGESEQDTVLPQNQIKQRPEISDEMRENAPRAASITRLRNGPTHVGYRELLGDGTINNAIQDRKWTASIKGLTKTLDQGE